MTATPLPSLATDPQVREARERLRAEEDLEAHLESRLQERTRTVEVLAVEFERLETEVFLEKAKPAALDTVRSAFAKAQDERQQAQMDLDAQRSRVARLRGVVQAVEQEAGAIVAQQLATHQREHVRALAGLLAEAETQALALRALREHALQEFNGRAVLAHVEPTIYDLFGRPAMDLPDIIRQWRAGREVRQILDAGE